MPIGSDGGTERGQHRPAIGCTVDKRAWPFESDLRDLTTFHVLIGRREPQKAVYRRRDRENGKSPVTSIQTAVLSGLTQRSSRRGNRLVDGLPVRQRAVEVFREEPGEADL